MLTSLFLFRSFLTRISRVISGDARWGEAGQATIAVGLLAFLATASTAATITIASGDVNFDAVQNLVDDSVSRISGTLEVRGSIIARSEDGVTVSSIQIPLRLYGESRPVPFSPDDPEHLVIALHDGEVYIPDVPYSVSMLSGNDDDQLDPWETALVTVDVASLPADPLTGETPALRASDRIALELLSPVGGTLVVERRLPMMLQNVMSLD